MKCPECQADNREGTTFCTESGSPLGVACATCGAESAPDNKFCGSCGKPLAGAGHPVRILESVIIGVSRVVHPQTQLIDALSES